MGTVYEIAQLGANILRQTAEPIADATAPGTAAMIAALQQALANTQGVGLAAPQISLSKRIIIVASRPTTRYPYAPVMAPTVMINPSFSPVSETKEKGWEGCLSVPSIRALVPRYVNILVHYTDPRGGLVDLPLEGFTARVFQHEYDHLEGLVFLDRVEDNRDIVAESEYFKRLSA
ncbi:MAG: peptide deformylase [Methylobacter sp.]|nr:MAG: peptide deformylase [Methylobacter sp.]